MWKILCSEMWCRAVCYRIAHVSYNGLFFSSEEVGSTFIRNVGKLIPDYTMSHDICMEGLWKPTINFNQDNWCTSWYSSQAPPKYKSQELSLLFEPIARNFLLISKTFMAILNRFIRLGFLKLFKYLCHSLKGYKLLTIFVLHIIRLEYGLQQVVILITI
jgi:hypothetical protein